MGLGREEVPLTSWLYQMSARDWPPERYREEVWERQITQWPTGRVAGRSKPREGDLIVTWYAKTGSEDPGLYGWGVIVRFVTEFDQIRWQPVFPSDFLKLTPIYDEAIGRVITGIRGRVSQGTMWSLNRGQLSDIRSRVQGHIAGSSGVGGSV